MAGTIDLVAAFGSMPTNIYLCAAAYQTADGGVLAGAMSRRLRPRHRPGRVLHHAPGPAALHDDNGDGKFDRLDPALGFTLQDLRVGSGGYAINWAAMPGHSYQVVWADALGATWSNLPAGADDRRPAAALALLHRRAAARRHPKVLSGEAAALAAAIQLNREIHKR